MANNIYQHQSLVNQVDSQRQAGHKSVILDLQAYQALANLPLRMR